MKRSYVQVFTKLFMLFEVITTFVFIYKSMLLIFCVLEIIILFSFLFFQGQPGLAGAPGPKGDGVSYKFMIVFHFIFVLNFLLIHSYIYS